MTDLKIDVQDLHKSFGKNEVLKGIDVQFNEGDASSVLQDQENQLFFGP